MKIVTIPHPTLRKKTPAVTQVNDRLIRFVNNLEQTLANSRNPRGVGLAAPQVNKLARVFATNFSAKTNRSQSKNKLSGELRHFINPRIVKACKRKKVLGVKNNDPDLEGCLSMPGLYGPVPRHRWVELEFQTLEDGQLIEHRQRFDDFMARIIQHELDHLDGILFTDYALENDLPVYRQSDDGKGWEEIERELIEII